MTHEGRGRPAPLCTTAVVPEAEGAQEAAAVTGLASAAPDDPAGLVHATACAILERIDLMISLVDMSDLPARTRTSLDRARREAARIVAQAARPPRPH